MSNMTERFKQAQSRINETIDVEQLLSQAVNMLDAHEGEEHVGAIEHLFVPQAVKALKESEILEPNKFYSKRQAAAAIWLLWRQM